MIPHTQIVGYQVGLATKIAYSVGALSDSIKTFSFSLFLLFYYTTVLGLPGTWLGLAMSIGLIWDAAVDPLIGHLSDRLNMRFGRRHTLMLIGAIGGGASFIAVFNPPSGLSIRALFVWLMMSSLCLRSSNSLFMVPYYALGAELTTDYHERTSISAYRAAAALAGMLLTAAAAFLVFLPNASAEVAGVDAKFAPDGYASMGVALGLAMTGAGLAATLGTLHERSRRTTSAATRDSTSAFQRAALETLRDPAFRVLLLSSSLAFMATAINAALTVHFLTYHVRIAASEAFMWYFVVLCAGALAGVPVSVRLGRSFEKHLVFAAATIMNGFVISGGYWLVGEGRPFGTGQFWILAVGSGLAGFFGAATGVIVPSMMADVVGEDERRRNRPREGVFFGMYSFSQQLSGGLAVLIAGVLVDRFAGLMPAVAEQSARTIERLVMISNLLPAALLVGAGVMALRYRLTHLDLLRREAAIQQQRVARHPASRI